MDLNSEQVTERVRLLANSILERFNEEQITPEEAGWVVLALTHRLLTVLEHKPGGPPGLCPAIHRPGESVPGRGFTVGPGGGIPNMPGAICRSHVAGARVKAPLLP